MEQGFGRYITILRHGEVAEHALDDRPAWVFSASGEAVVWANAAGLAFLDIKELAGLERFRLGAASPVARRLAELAKRGRATAGGLERFRFFVGVRAKPAACLCRPVRFGESEAGVLAVAVDTDAGPVDAAAGLFAALRKAGMEAALFEADGTRAAATGELATLPASADALTDAPEAAGVIRLAASDGTTRLIVVENPSALQAATAEEDSPDDLAGPGAEGEAGERHEAPAASDGGSADLAGLQPEVKAEAIDESRAESEDDGGVELAAQPPESDVEPAEEAPSPIDDGGLDVPRPQQQADTEAGDETADAVDDIALAPAGETAKAPEGADKAAPEVAEELSAGLEADRPDEAEREEAPAPGSLSEAIARLSVPLVVRDEPFGRLRLVSDRDEDGEAEEEQAAAASPPAEARSAPASDFRFAPRGAPHRFVWEMNEDRRFAMVSGELAQAVGPNAADIIGRTWPELSASFGLDNATIAAAIEAGETWTAERVDWPVEGSERAAPVELTALPIYHAGRRFGGYRGFGVCRTDRAHADPAGRGLALASRPVSADDVAPVPAEAVPLATTEDGGAGGPGAPTGTARPDPARFVTPEVAGPAEEQPGATGKAETGPAAGEAPRKGLMAGWAGAAMSAFGFAAASARRANEMAPPPERQDMDTGAAETDKAVQAAEPDAALDESGAQAPRADETERAVARADILGLFVGRPTPQDERAMFTAEPNETAKAAESDVASDEPGPQEPRGDEAVRTADILGLFVGTPTPQDERAAFTAEPGETVEPSAAGGTEAAAAETASERQAEPAEPVPDETQAAGRTAEILGLFVGAETPPEERAAFSAGAEAPAPAAAPEEAAGGTVDALEEKEARAPATEEDTPAGADAAMLAEASETFEAEAAEAAAAEDGAEHEAEPPVATDVSPGESAHVADQAEPGASSGTPEPPETSASNVVPLTPQVRAELGTEDRRSKLTRPERDAFLQIAEALGARVEHAEDTGAAAPEAPDTPAIEAVEPEPPAVALPSAFATGLRDLPEGVLLDRLPTGVLLCRGDEVLFANKAALALLGYGTLADLRQAGGLGAIFTDGERAARATDADDADRAVTLRTRSGATLSLFARLYSVPWAGDRALMIVFDVSRRGDLMFVDARQSGDERVEELESILDTATDGVIVMEPDGTILAVNRSAEALFGADRTAMTGRKLTDYLAPESHRSALDYLDGLARNGVESVLNDGREVIGLESSGGLIPVFMTIGRIDKGAHAAKFCAVLRDITQWKKAEEELTTARRQAETASSQKSEFLAKISHEIRTPLNAIIGFSEVMLGERLGPIGTERYKEYLNDIRASGDYIMSLINDLLDLSKIEAGKMDLKFEAVSLNEILHNCVALMQPEANRERIIIRTSLSTAVPDVVADARSIQQIVLNLLSNAIKYNKRGGQVIVSSVYTEEGDVAVRVRDTGIGMSDEEVRLALEPFRQIQTTRGNTAGTGLGLPLTKALVEANRASFAIDSKPREGTLVEILFPSPRVLAE